MRNDIEKVLKEYEISTFGNKKNLEIAESKLSTDEIVQYISPTNAVIYNVNTRKKEQLPGIFILTDKRLVFSYKAGIAESTESITLADIEAINCFGNSLTGGHIEIHARTKTLDILVSYKKEIINKIQNTINETLNNYKNQSKIVIQNSSSSADEIIKFKQLLDMGVITQEEFEQKKKQLLDSSSQNSEHYTPDTEKINDNGNQIMNKEKEHRKKKRFLPFLIVLCLFGFFVIVDKQRTKNQDNFIIDVGQFSKITSVELNKIMGKPEDIEEWNYDTGVDTFPAITYSYKLNNFRYEFLEIDKKIVRLTIYSSKYNDKNGDSFKYKDEKELFSMFGLKKTKNTVKVADTNSALRYQPVSDTVYDYWIPILDSNKKTFDIAKFTYDKTYFGDFDN